MVRSLTARDIIRNIFSRREVNIIQLKKETFLLFLFLKGCGLCLKNGLKGWDIYKKRVPLPP